MNDKRSAWAFLIERRAVAWLVLIGIGLLGGFAATTLPKEIQPEITIPFASITTIYPGAPPTDIESLITIPVENAIAPVDKVKNITSSSGPGISTIVIEFEADADIDKTIQDVREAVNRVESELPEDAESPLVAAADPNAQPVANFSIVGPAPLHDLTEIAKKVRDELKEIPGIAEVEIIGGQEKEIIIEIEPHKAESYGLDIFTITQILKGSQGTFPLTTLNIDNINYTVRADATYESIREIEDTPLRMIGESAILLKDLATVRETFPENQVLTRLSAEGKEASPTVTLRIFKKEKANVISVIDKAKELTESQEALLPKEIRIVVSSDMSAFIRTDLGILIQSGIQTTILIMLILFLAMGLVEGLVAGLTIPLTLLASVILMDLMGLSINSLTLFSLVIALGLMVDTAIVMIEGIHEGQRKGLTSKNAALGAIETYKWPLIAGTMTTVFAFFPMLLVSGIVGEFLKSLPLTISAALLSSLFISLALSPALLTKFLAKRSKEHTGLLHPLFEHTGHGFERMTDRILHSRLIRIMILLLALILFVGSMMLPISGLLKVEMFPQTDVQFFAIQSEAPEGVSLEHTKRTTEKIEHILYEIPEIENFVSVIGSGQGQIATDIFEVSQGTRSNEANITVNLVPKDQRERKSYEVASEIRERIKSITTAKITIREFSEGPPSSAPITVNITGAELQTLKEISREIEALVSSLPGTQNVHRSLTGGMSEFVFHINRDKAAFHGIPPLQAMQTVRGAINGITLTELNWKDEELPLKVQYQLPRAFSQLKGTIDTIKNLEIISPKGGAVPLTELGSFQFTEGLSVIQREDRTRIAKVYSDLEKGANATEINAELMKRLAEKQFPNGYEIFLGGETEDIDESFRDLFRSMIIGVILIAFTLVLVFNSLKQPFIILLTLPLALIGVFPGLMIMGLFLSFPAFLGVVALAGVVVNDAIVLIDRINVNRRNSIPIKEAISEAGRARLQPIIMTSVTTIAGILPLALTNEFWAGLGFALIFGLAASTFLTLIVVPVLYYIFEAGKASS